MFLCSSCNGTKYSILYPVYNGIFDYLRAVVYNLYRSIFSTGAAMESKQKTVTKIMLPTEIHVADTPWASVDTQTHTFTLFFVSSVFLPSDDVLCWPLSCSFLLPALPAFFVPGLIWYGSVYLVTTAGFVADQSM